MICDIDGNGVFNSIDFAYMKMYLTGTKELTKGHLESADVDNNGEANSIDFAIMRQVIFENEVNVHVAFGWTKKRTKSLTVFMPVLDCPNCSNETYECAN
jgi:hypothetical protein